MGRVGGVGVLLRGGVVGVWWCGEPEWSLAVGGREELLRVGRGSAELLRSWRSAKLLLRIDRSVKWRWLERLEAVLRRLLEGEVQWRRVVVRRASLLRTRPVGLRRRGESLRWWSVALRCARLRRRSHCSS